MKKQKPATNPPFDRIAVLRANLDELEKILRQDPHAFGEVIRLPPPTVPADMRELICTVSTAIYTFLKEHDYLNVSFGAMGLVVSQFLCGLDDEFRILARKIGRLQKTAPQLFVRVPVADVRESFRLLCFPKVDLDHPPDEAAVKKNYKRLSAEHHPDRTHDHERGPFLRVQKAWETVQEYYEDQMPWL